MISRRTLLQATVAAALTPPRFQGFIVSDAHFGWENAQQPSPDAMRRSMEHILRRFPSLDVLIDSGDAHHNSAPDSARADWTDIIAGGCGALPLFYCMGNHEQSGQEDSEARTCRLGSVSCRPYQSWTLRGIHFVMAPQLMHACYVTEETLDWLALDLSAHRDLTTILISHNSLTGTTKSGFDVGYRRVVNSPVVLDLLRQHPNVLAWMHGHNHTWELVPAFGKLFVSNGRIGGFDPGGPGGSGKGHTGGIFFEIASDRLSVRGYSATREAFFDEFDPGSRYMNQQLAAKTSLDPRAPASVCYGVGRARPGQRTPVWRHHAGSSIRAEVFLALAKTRVISENAGLRWYTQRVEGGGKKPTTKILPGFGIAPRMAKGDDPDQTWEWSDKGLRLKALQDLSITRRVLAPDARAGRFQYYRCSPGTRIAVELLARSEKPGPRGLVRCSVFDSAGQERAVLDGGELPLANAPAAWKRVFEVPPASGAKSIYAGVDSDVELQVSVELALTGLSSDVVVEKFEIALESPASGAALAIDKTRVGAGTTAPPRGGRAVVESLGLASWLIRESGLEWQVRNACAAMRDGWIEFDGLRNRFSPKREVVIAPLSGQPALFVHRLRQVRSARILPATSARPGVAIELRETYAPVEVELVAASRPARVDGAEHWTYRDGRVIVSHSAPGRIEVTPE